MARLRPVLIAGALLLPLLLGAWSQQTEPPVTEPTAPEQGGEECGLAAPPDAEFVGRLSAITNNLARFQVTRTVQGQVPDGPVTVIFEEGQEQFLRTGTEYRVEVIRTGFGFSSSLTPGDCGNDPTTVYADGNPVNTSVLADTRGPLIRYAVLIVIGFLAVIAAVGGLALWANKVRGDGEF